MKHLLLTIFLICFFFGLKAQNNKVVGFLPHYRFDYVDDINFEAITHLNLAFANPNMNGDLSFENAPIAYTINKAKENDVKVFISLAGGYLTPEWDAAWQQLMKEENRSDYIHKIVTYVLDNNCDGVDVDLEWQYVNNLYSPFVNDLIDSLHSHDLVCSASLPGTYRYPEITDKTLDKLDWVNMMVYDLTGPWDPNNAGPHSPFSFAENSLFYWNNQGLINEKLTLGMPFYGYDFTNSQSVSAYTYRYIVSLDNENANYDQAGEIYYNGIPTIKAKTQFALEEELLGVMIWELGQDSYDEFSLLDAIDEVIQDNLTSTATTEFKEPSIYPNPFSQNLTIEAEFPFHFQLFDMQGMLFQSSSTPQKTHSIETHTLQVGMYVIRLKMNDKTIVKTISKQY